jgi:Predicted membrane protein (DUF2157)
VSPARFNRVVQRQLDQLLREGLLDGRTHAALAQRYPVTSWNWTALGRWFTIFGAISLAAGVVMLARTLFQFTLHKLAVLLALATVALFAAGWRLRDKPYIWTRRSLELLGGLALIGLTFTLGIIYSTGSGNWPALLLIDLCVLLPLAYVLRNLLLLVLSAVVFFTWFGGVTGYMSDWGAYWFGMNYPLRFLVMGILIAFVGLLHRQAEGGPLTRFQGFFYVWLAAGAFFSEMALWLMSLFGNFGSIKDYSYQVGAGELFLFNVLWTGLNAGLLWLGAHYQVRMLRGFAVTFLIIQGYTLYFWHVARHLGPVLSFFIAGASALGLVAYFERRRQARRV